MLFTLVFLSLFGTAGPSAQGQTPTKYWQPATERESLLREAIENRYTIRRVEFVGNDLPRYQVLGRRIYLVEGDVFTGRNLQRSILGLNKLKIIYPVAIDDVWVDLDRTEKLIDLTIRLRERRSVSKRAS